MKAGFSDRRPDAPGAHAWDVLVSSLSSFIQGFRRTALNNNVADKAAAHFRRRRPEGIRLQYGLVTSMTSVCPALDRPGNAYGSYLALVSRSTIFARCLHRPIGLPRMTTSCPFQLSPHLNLNGLPTAIESIIQISTYARRYHASAKCRFAPINRALRNPSARQGDKSRALPRRRQCHHSSCKPGSLH